MSPVQKYIAAAVAIVAAIAVVMLLRHHGATETAKVGAGGIVMPDKISTADHDAYVASAIPSCKTETAKQPRMIEQHVADSAIADYCKCFAEKSADQLTQSEMDAMARKSMPASFMTKVQNIAKGCVAQYLPPAPDLTPAPATTPAQ